MKEHIHLCKLGFITPIMFFLKTGGGRGNQSVNHTNSRRVQALLPTQLCRIHPFSHPTIYLSIPLLIHPLISKGVWRGDGTPDGHVRCGADARVSRSGLCWEPPTRRGAEPEPTQGWKCSGSAAPASAPWTRRSSARSACWTTPSSPAASR